ncbi:MAG: DUF4936 family protein [Burkholderiales bacterium]|jgi:hypothetical protein|nr:DUF4936 family protein [Burkholderiales bacterium]
MRELFIYYRIEASSAAFALDAAQAMQYRLRTRFPTLAARLLRRPDEPGTTPNDQQTWMEIYSSPDSGGISPGLQAEIEAEAAVLAPFIVGTRHIEVFVPCVS